MKTGRVALPATVVAAMGGPAMVLCLAGASPIATVATLRSADTWRPTAGPEVVVPAVAAMAAWLLIAWLTVVTGLMLVAQLRGLPGQLAGRLVATVAPLAVRRLVEAALGVTLASGAVAGVGVVPACAATPLPAAASPIAAADPAGTAIAVVGRVTVGFDWPADRSEEPATRAAWVGMVDISKSSGADGRVTAARWCDRWRDQCGAMRRCPGSSRFGSRPITARLAAYQRGHSVAMPALVAPGPRCRAAIAHRESPRWTTTWVVVSLAGVSGLS